MKLTYANSETYVYVRLYGVSGLKHQTVEMCSIGHTDDLLLFKDFSEVPLPGVSPFPPIFEKSILCFAYGRGQKLTK